MAEANYEVSSSVAVTEEFQRLIVTARNRGVLSAVVPAARWIMEELARSPMLFGESRDFLPHMQLHLRIGFAGPISVQSAVHEPSRHVFIRRFKLRG
ncbi:MAG: hypothetical protein C0467_11800 [Planctomycetaceae bacterium]|nr:hypothetical protein [Planctomycetaceae bacterium]